MRKINIDSLIGVGLSNKYTDKANMQIYRRLLKDFSLIKSFWGKAFFIFLAERSDNADISNCGKKLHLEMKARENSVYERYIKHFMTELKKDFFNNYFDTISDNITDSMVTYGQEEFIILNKIIFNCTDKFKFSKVSYTKDMRNLIETSYI
jgi:hypothetical protein